MINDNDLRANSQAFKVGLQSSFWFLDPEKWGTPPAYQDYHVLLHEKAHPHRDGASGAYITAAPNTVTVAAPLRFSTWGNRRFTDLNMRKEIN